MVIEHAILTVKSSETENFEEAFAQAIRLVAASPGCLNARLERCLETENRYQLVIEWESLESHTRVFRESPLYAQFRALLIDFYDEKPVVDHYQIVLRSTD